MNTCGRRVRRSPACSVSGCGFLHGYRYASRIFRPLAVLKPTSFSRIDGNPNTRIRHFTIWMSRTHFWATRLVLKFNDEDIRKIVAVGEISNKEAEEYLVRTLIKRRNKVGDYWLRQVSSLDGFRVVNGELLFDDLLLKYGFEKEMREHQVRFASFNNETGARSNVGSDQTIRQARLPLPPAITSAQENSFHVVTLAADAHVVDVFLKTVSGTLTVVGIQRK